MHRTRSSQHSHLHIEWSRIQFEAIARRYFINLMTTRAHSKPTELFTMKTNGFSAFSPLAFEFIVYFLCTWIYIKNKGFVYTCNGEPRSVCGRHCASLINCFRRKLCNSHTLHCAVVESGFSFLSRLKSNHLVFTFYFQSVRESVNVSVLEKIIYCCSFFCSFFHTNSLKLMLLFQEKKIV